MITIIISICECFVFRLKQFKCKKLDFHTFIITDIQILKKYKKKFKPYQKYLNSTIEISCGSLKKVQKCVFKYKTKLSPSYFKNLKKNSADTVNPLHVSNVDQIMKS